MRELKKKRAEIEKARKIGLFGRYDTQLLELRFLVDHVLASHRIELRDFHLTAGRLLVLRGGVEVTGTGRRFKLDLFAGAFRHGETP